MFKNFHKIKFVIDHTNRQRGMTLVELMVVIAIFIMITSVSIFDYGSFRSSVSVRNLADDIALSIRKAQSYSIGVHALSGMFSSGFGVHFTTNTDVSIPIAGSNKSFVIFNDMPPNDKVYNFPTSGACGTGNECNEILNIIGTGKISEIDIGDIKGVSPISNVNGSLDISFMRPNPDAYFCYKSSAHDNSPSCTSSSDTGISNVQIKVSDDLNKKFQTISIWNTGQISVQ